jgi:hypothetical protein
MAGMVAWRDIAVLETLLRLMRTGRVATPELIADEAILHLGDVYDGVAGLVAAGLVTVSEPDDRDDGVVVSLSMPLRALVVDSRRALPT